MKRSALLFSTPVFRTYSLILLIVLAACLTTSSRSVYAQSAPLSDISVLKSGDETATPGSQITYQVVVTNGGPDDADNVVLSDPLPAHTTFVSASVSQGSFTNDGTTVTASFGTIVAFESASLTLKLTVDSNTEPGTTITNTASARSSSADNDLTNNQASASTQVVAPAADLSVSKTGDDTAPVGGHINYTIFVGNFGTLDATNVVLTDPIPGHTTYVTSSSSQGSTSFDGTSMTASLGTIPAGSVATVSLTVSINNDTPRDTTIVNTATATSSTTERNPEDNTSSAFTQVTGIFAGDLIISEFRLRGPGVAAIGAPADETRVVGRPDGNGGKLHATPSQTAAVGGNQAFDEFVEIYNNTGDPITVSAADESSGFAVAASDGVVRFIIPNGTVIPARGHFLGVNINGYSLSGYPGGNGGTFGDATYSQDIPDNAGIALFRTANPENFSTGTRLDAVGSTTEANSLYKEGTGYPALNPATSSLEYSFFRDSCGKGGSTSDISPCNRFTPKDTDNNAADFVFVDTDGTNVGAGQRLGAPGPENLNSPIQNNGAISGALLDSTKSFDAPPNRVRDLTPGPSTTSAFGTLDVRRRITNNTDLPVTRLRFRVIDISTFLAPIGTADLRVLTSTPLEVSGINDSSTCAAAASETPCTVTVRGLILEQPPAQPFGGGFNSSVSDGLVNLQTPLAPGQSINIRFLFGVQKTGFFRAIFNIEMLNQSQIPSTPVKQANSTKGR